MTSNTGVNMVHRALQVVLLVGATTGRVVKLGCKSILAVVNPGSGPAAVGSKAYNGYQ
eukprot:Ihof_evm3s763 gene=Ihof_evmTU3s763